MVTERRPFPRLWTSAVTFTYYNDSNESLALLTDWDWTGLAWPGLAYSNQKTRKAAPTPSPNQLQFDFLWRSFVEKLPACIPSEVRSFWSCLSCSFVLLFSVCCLAQPLIMIFFRLCVCVSGCVWWHFPLLSGIVVPRPMSMSMPMPMPMPMPFMSRPGGLVFSVGVRLVLGAGAAHGSRSVPCFPTLVNLIYLIKKECSEFVVFWTNLVSVKNLHCIYWGKANVWLLNFSLNFLIAPRNSKSRFALQLLMGWHSTITNNRRRQRQL